MASAFHVISWLYGLLPAWLQRPIQLVVEEIRGALIVAILAVAFAGIVLLVGIVQGEPAMWVIVAVVITLAAVTMFADKWSAIAVRAHSGGGASGIHDAPPDPAPQPQLRYLEPIGRERDGVYWSQRVFFSGPDLRFGDVWWHCPQHRHIPLAFKREADGAILEIPRRVWGETHGEVTRNRILNMRSCDIWCAGDGAGHTVEFKRDVGDFWDSLADAERGFAAQQHELLMRYQKAQM